ncbi:unnamed protein product, partial [Candidula unifasciata]
MDVLLQSSPDTESVDSITKNNVFFNLTITLIEQKWSPSPDPVSNEVREMFRKVVLVFICGTVSLFGIGANVTNIVVFIRQGFKDSINISLLGRITSLVTAFITLERCLCVTIPLKVKDVITPFRTKFFILSFFIVMIGLFAPFYFVNQLAWAHNPLRNTTILSLAFSENK